MKDLNKMGDSKSKDRQPSLQFSKDFFLLLSEFIYINFLREKNSKYLLKNGKK